MITVDIPVVPLDSCSFSPTVPKLESVEDFKKKGFVPLNDQILRGNDLLYVYFLENKPLVLVSCDILLEKSVRDFHLPIVSWNERAHPANLMISYCQNDTLYKLCLNGEILGEDSFTSQSFSYSGSRRIRKKQEQEEEEEPYSLSSQLLRAGFTEESVDFQFSLTPFQNQQEMIFSLIQNRVLSRETFNTFTSILIPQFCRVNGRENGKYLFNLLDQQQKQYDNFLEKRIKVLQSGISEKVKLNGNAIQHVTIYVKKILTPFPRVFLVICKENKVLNVLTTLYNLKQGGTAREIRGNLINVELQEKPVLIFQEENGKKTSLHL